MFKKCSSKFSFFKPQTDAKCVKFSSGGRTFSVLKNIFLERYINYYVELYHYTRINTHNKKIN